MFKHNLGQEGHFLTKDAWYVARIIHSNALVILLVPLFIRFRELLYLSQLFHLLLIVLISIKDFRSHLLAESHSFQMMQFLKVLESTFVFIIGSQVAVAHRAQKVLAKLLNIQSTAKLG